MNTFQVTDSIGEIYADIEGELCSKQTVLINQIQKKYGMCYQSKDYEI